MASLKTRVWNVVISADQFFGSVITLGACWPDETPSSYAYRIERQGKPWGFLRPLIDGLFFWQDGHCEKAFLAERARRQVPLELR